MTALAEHTEGTDWTPRVIVVDDDRFHRELAVDALRGVAHVRACSNASEALEALEEAPADLVLSDLEMPETSGVELLQRVRHDHPGTDFMLLTGNASLDSAIAALRQGAVDYLRKPIDPEELALVVKRCLSQRRLLRENTRLRDALETIDATRTLSSCLEPRDVYTAALELALRILPRRRGGAIFHRGMATETDGALLRGFDDAEATILTRELAREKPLDWSGHDPVFVHQRGRLLDALREAGCEPTSVLSLSLAGDDGESGLLFFPDDHGEPFGGPEIERATILADQTNAALRNAERYIQAKERAFIDDVTEVYNARYLLEATDRELRRAERYKSDLSVLFLDLDRFKLVNDNYGHLVGSNTLRQLARVLQDCVRQVDTLARYGGDEFTIILVDTDEPGSLLVAERIRQTVEETAFEAGPDRTLHLTCSVGVASYPVHGASREALLDAADKAMYRAKSRGRNRVCSAAEL